jgi:beta-N-acetylhexosaminidase
VDDHRRLALGCLLPGFVGAEPPDWLRRRLAGGLAGVTLFARNVRDPDQLAALCERLRAERPDVLIGIDEEGGDVTRLEAARGSSYPGNLALGAVDDVDLTRAVATALGADLAAAGVNLDLAPVADVNSNPDNPIIGVRSFGADPRLVAAHTAAFVDGLQSRGVAACVKHFPGHGDTTMDSHLDVPVVADDERALETALLPFRAAIAAGVRAVMTAHLLVPAWDSVPATLSRPILTGWLRERLGFRGLVVTDGLEMAAITATVGLTGGAVAAIRAGADAICVGGGLADEEVVDLLVRALADAAGSGELAEERLAEAAGRLPETALWAEARRGPGQRSERSVGLEAARRAVRARGLDRLPPGPVVAELRPEPSVAVGLVPWGLGDVLGERDPGVTVRTLERPAEVDALLAAAAGRPLVLVGRDLHRHPRHEAAVEAVLARRPDAVIVEMGLPARPSAAARAYVATRGAARVSALAAADLLSSGGVPMTDDGPSPAASVRQAALDAVTRLDLAPVAAAAVALAERVRAGGLLYVFGAGHSQLLALEGFYRAGGPAWLVPVLDDRLSSARGFNVTEFERRPGLGGSLVAGLDPRGALLIVSSSGRNAAPVEAALAARAAGLLTIAITTPAPGNRLAEAAEHVLDSAVPPGDAAVAVGGVRMGPVSTVAGATLLHALLAQTESALGTGEVLVSNNVDGGDERNAALIARHSHLRP